MTPMLERYVFTPYMCRVRSAGGGGGKKICFFFTTYGPNFPGGDNKIFHPPPLCTRMIYTLKEIVFLSALFNSLWKGDTTTYVVLLSFPPFLQP